MDFEIQLPEEITNLMNGGGLPSPEMMNFYVDEKDRIFFIDFEIDQSLIEIERKILQYNRIDKDVPVEQRKPIKLFIYSYGGELDAMFSFIDVVALSKTPVWTINAGIAMSAALVMLLSGQKRFALPHSTALIHSGSGGTQGTFEQTSHIDLCVEVINHFTGVIYLFCLITLFRELSETAFELSINIRLNRIISNANQVILVDVITDDSIDRLHIRQT